MKFLPTKLPGVTIIEPEVRRDPRGFFFEFYHKTKFETAGLPGTFVQDNHSRSAHGTLRGLHAQLKSPQGKLVRVVEGEVWDVAVDIRKGSPTFGRWTSVTLSAENHRAIHIPVGFAHGFVVLSDAAQVEYKCTALYDPSDELRLLWNDPALGIDWPLKDPVLSEKDAAAKPLKDWMDALPTYA